MRKVSKMLHDSIAHALVAPSPRPSSTRSSSAAASTASDTDKFVGMYVNQLTLDYGTRGRAALERFFGEASRRVSFRPECPWSSLKNEDTGKSEARRRTK